ncbi:MAG: glycosyltransferase family 2 protein [Patescibacteria group bacterium]
MENLVYQEFSAVVPAYNEAKRFPKVIRELLSIETLKEVILVDDGSSDETENVASDFKKYEKFHYIKHKKNHGKGAALKTGLSKAKSEVILFLDADLENITNTKIKKIITPVLKDEVDVSRGAFRRKRGRVTEYAVKPMMEILFLECILNNQSAAKYVRKNLFCNQLILKVAMVLISDSYLMQ